MGREVTAVSAPDATMLLLVWPRRIRPLIRGADRGEVEAAFPELGDHGRRTVVFQLCRKLLEVILRPDEKWYRLRRKPSLN